MNRSVTTNKPVCILTLEALESRYTPTVAYTFLDSGSNVLLSGTTATPNITLGTVAGDVEIDGSDTGVLASDVDSLTLTGGTEANAFTLDLTSYTALTSANVSGSLGTDTLALAGGHTWSVGVNAGTVGVLAFSSVEALAGGTGDDVFVMASSSSRLFGHLDGGGEASGDTLDYSAFAARSVQANLTSGGATNITAGISSIENLTGGGLYNVLVGDSRANILTGGSGSDILIGGGGDDTLDGQGGYNLLAGGGGTDTLADNGNDILVGGSTAYDSAAMSSNVYTPFQAIEAEWSRPTVALNTRWAHITGSPGGLNGTYYLDAAHLIDDGVMDVIIGGPGAEAKTLLI